MSSGIDMAVFMIQWYNHGYTFVNHHFWANVEVQRRALTCPLQPLVSVILFEVAGDLANRAV